MNILAILGGSGSGKSTVTYTLLDQFPDKYCALHLDDFQSGKLAPVTKDGIKNRDHPDGVNFTALYQAILDLKTGKPVTLKTWDRRLKAQNNNGGDEKITVTIEPKETLIVEGFLALYDPRIHAIVDKSFYLDLPQETRLERREKFIDPTYRDDILIPMHNTFVEPQKDYADYILDVSHVSPNDVADFIDLENKP